MKLAGVLKSFRSRVWERLLLLHPPYRPDVPPSWEIGATSDLVVRWPERYQWPAARRWSGPLLEGLGQHVHVEIDSLPQPHQGIVRFQFGRPGRMHDVALDYSDYQDRIDHDCLAQVDLYFKMQHLRSGYRSPKIVPGGYVTWKSDFYHYVARLRRLADRESSSYDVYGRFGLESAAEIRRRAVQLLRKQSRFDYEGELKRIRYSRFLEEVARSRVCIDLPGNGDFCFRLIDYLGVGACIIGVRHRTVLHVPLEETKHIVYAKDDLSDLVELCTHYLEHDDERREMVQNSRDFFDRYLHRDQLARYYLFRLRNLIEGSHRPRKESGAG